jgi:RNA polymerase sigma factor (TIGR02999 family)
MRGRRWSVTYSSAQVTTEKEPGVVAGGTPPPRITQLLQQVVTGDREARERLRPLVYNELRRLARRQLAGEREGQILSAVALVNEAFLNLTIDQAPARQNRAHFFGLSANAMRRILVDYARTRNPDKRGSGLRPIPLGKIDVAMPAAEAERLLAFDPALDRLALIDPQAAQVVEHRHFAGATLDEAALALGISRDTAARHWAFATACLKAELADYAPGA